MRAKRTLLSIRAPAGCVFFALPLGISNALIATFFVWSFVDQIRLFFMARDFTVGTILGYLALLIIIAILLYLCAAMAWVFLRIARTRLWLRGTFLVERGIVLRRHVDLRSATIELHRSNNTDKAEISLVATDRRSGKAIDLLLFKDGKPLPATELAALVEAIRSGRRDDDYPEVATIIDTLSKIAAAPAAAPPGNSSAQADVDLVANNHEAAMPPVDDVTAAIASREPINYASDDPRSFVADNRK